MNMNFKRKLLTPQEIKQMYPLSEDLALKKYENDKEVQDIITGTSLL